MEEIRLKKSYYQLLLEQYYSTEQNRFRQNKTEKAFLNHAVLKLNHFTETSEKPLRLRLDKTFGKIFHGLGYITFVQLGSERMLEKNREDKAVNP